MPPFPTSSENTGKDRAYNLQKGCNSKDSARRGRLKRRCPPQASAVYLLDSKTMFSDTYRSAFSTAIKRRRPA